MPGDLFHYIVSKHLLGSFCSSLMEKSRRQYIDTSARIPLPGSWTVGDKRVTIVES